MKIALFFGSFNPIHTGHLIIANHILNSTDCDKVWLVISPQNPLKDKHSLLNEYDRLHLARLAVEDNYKLEICNEEFHLPRPSYTIDTLTYLKEKYPTHIFSLIMGADNIANITKWKNYQLLLDNYTIYVYNRKTENISNQISSNITYLDAPLLDISSTYIRELLKNKKSITYLVPKLVEEYIINNNLYQK